MGRRPPLCSLCTVLAAAQLLPAFTRLSSETASTFDHYVELAEAGMKQNLNAAHFLSIKGRSELEARVRSGEVPIERMSAQNSGETIRVPGGQIQDWLGTIFIPGANISGVRARLQDYDRYKQMYAPDVIDSKLKSRQDDEFDVFLRLYKKQILLVVLNTDYHVRYATLDSGRATIVSRSTRIAEVDDPNRSYTEEKPVGDDTGFLWRMNTYWRLEQASGGVYAELRAISLSRDVPFALGMLIGGFVQKFPRESMKNTLEATRRAVTNR